MCDICMHSPCLSGCPNAPDPTPVTYCRSCGEPIVPGDEYADIDGEAWCEGCLDDLPLCVLIPKLGWEWKTVQEGENIQCVDCKCCGDTEPLPVGTEYGEIDGDACCEECLEDTPLSDLVCAHRDRRPAGQCGGGAEFGVHQGRRGLRPRLRAGT